MKTSFFNLLFIALFALGLTACGGEQTAPQTNTPAPSTSQAPASTASASLSGTVENGVRVLTINPVGEEMKFEQTALTVTAGEQVKVVFKNTATSVAMQHNVVLLNDREAINRVGMAALEAADTEYVPKDDAIIVATPLAQPGQTVEVTFTAPTTPGEYVYICTFPGHYMMMQGTLTVVANPNA